MLATLLELGPSVRGALMQLATSVGHQRGLVDAVRDNWPAELPAADPSKTTELQRYQAKDLRLATELAPRWHHAWQVLAVVQERAGPSRVPARSYERAFENSGRQNHVLLALRAYVRVGAWERARALLPRARQTLGPKDARVARYLEEVEQQLRD